MIRFTLCIWVLIQSTACVSPGKESEWIVLDSAQSVSCGQWPQTQNDLRIDDLTVLAGSPPEFLVIGVDRMGHSLHYSYGFEDDVDIDKDKIRQFQFGIGSVLLGGKLAGKKGTVVIARNRNDKSTIEYRDIKSNVVDYKQALAASEIIEGRLTSPSSTSAWLMHKLDGSGVRLARLDINGSKPAMQQIAGLEFDQYPVMLPSKEKNQSLVMWSQGVTGKVFRIKAISAAGKVEKASVLEAKISSQVESWMAAPLGDGYLLAYIDGDSLVGQARLRLLGFTFNYGVAQPSWEQEIILSDVHVTEPVIFDSGDRLNVLLLNWIDGESTIVQYEVKGNSVSDPEYKGIFPKGSRVIDAFYSGGESYAILRHREGAGWAFKICEI